MPACPALSPQVLEERAAQGLDEEAYVPPEGAEQPGAHPPGALPPRLPAAPVSEELQSLNAAQVRPGPGLRPARSAQLAGAVPVGAR